MQVKETSFPGLKRIQPSIYADSRGYFFEPYRATHFRDAGITVEFLQDNFSHSHQGVLRGLHYEIRNPQAQLVFVSHGEIFDVVVDLRPGSPTFGRSHSMVLSAEAGEMLFHPPGFAHGYIVLSATANVHYKVTRVYDPSDEATLAWDDPDLAIAWPSREPLISDKDATGRQLRDLTANELPHVDWRVNL